MKKILLFLLIFIATERFCHFQTGGFALQKMLTDRAPAPSTPLFSEPLTFIGAGKQFYAFETADHQYVVKFMKFSRRRPLPWLEKLPLPFKQNILAERAKRLSNLISSTQLALHRLPEETGLIPSSPSSQTITLIDKLGIHHQISLATTRFVIQKKAIPFTTYFDDHPSEARSLITSYIQTISSQCHKGICNLDPILERNFGVVDHQMVLIDIGSFLAHDKLKTSAGIQREIFLELLPLREWLQTKHPEHLPYFDQQLKMIAQQ